MMWMHGWKLKYQRVQGSYLYNYKYNVAPVVNEEAQSSSFQLTFRGKQYSEFGAEITKPLQKSPCKSETQLDVHGRPTTSK